ncbi:hypothetical protein DL96DRAFT_1469718 [Flagelloscypha sp. PMI_526]|nr:hypothetical protein DL96DRAFT_1469718 [Flagelloscypha sp. PMI_526]
MEYPLLENYRVLPGFDVFYMPEFVSEIEEEFLIRKIRETPQPKWRVTMNLGRSPPPLIIIYIGGEITSKNTLLSRPMPPYLTSFPNIIGRLKDTGAFTASPHQEPNHVILNEYLPGQGIMPHEDGPAYHPMVATISLGSHAMFHYFKYKEGEKIIDSPPLLSMLLEPRSVVITTGALYQSHLHGIREVETDSFMAGTPPRLSDLDAPVDNWTMLKNAEIKEVVMQGGTLDRGTRWSLTCRDVQKVKVLR